LELLHDSESCYLTEVFPDKIVAPYQFECGQVLWCGGHCTGTHTISMLCVDCAEKKNIISNAEVDKIVAKAEVHKREVELLIEYGR